MTEACWRSILAGWVAHSYSQRALCLQPYSRYLPMQALIGHSTAVVFFNLLLGCVTLLTCLYCQQPGVVYAWASASIILHRSQAGSSGVVPNPIPYEGGSGKWSEIV